MISQSQRDVQPVFEAIAANAQKLCQSTNCGVFTFDGELIHLVAVTSISGARIGCSQTRLSDAARAEEASQAAAFNVGP